MNNIDEEYAKLACILNSFKELHSIWEKIGFSKSVIDDRSSQVMKHCKDILDRMIVEELQLKEEYQIKVQDLHKKVSNLCQLLCHEPITFDNELSLLQQKRILNSKLEKLTIEKDTLLGEMEKLKSEDTVLCKFLGHQMFYINSPIPTKSDLIAYKNHLDQLNKEKINRSAMFQTLIAKIGKLYKELEYEPQNDLEKHLVNKPQSINLTTETLSEMKELLENLKFQKIERQAKHHSLSEKLKQIWMRLDLTEDFQNNFLHNSNDLTISTLKRMEAEYTRCREILISNLETYIKTLRLELKNLWKQCYVDEERINFSAMYSENFSDDLIDLHEQEIGKWKNYLSKIENIKALIEERNYLWDKMIHLEIQVKDTNRFKNRGGNLLLEEKERKKVSIKLPKVEYQISALIMDWEKVNGQPFMFHGTSFTEYIQQQWAQFYYNKEQEKEIRMKAKKEATKLEMTYGCKAITPLYSSKSKIYQSGNLNSLLLGTSSIHKSKKISLTKLMSPKYQHSSLKNLQNRQIINKYKKRSSRIMRGHKNPRVSRKLLNAIENIEVTPSKTYNSYLHGVTASAPPKDKMYPKMGPLTYKTPAQKAYQTRPERVPVPNLYSTNSQVRPQKCFRNLKISTAARDKRQKQDGESVNTYTMSSSSNTNSTHSTKPKKTHDAGQQAKKGDENAGDVTMTDSYKGFMTGLDKVEIPFCHSSQMEDYEDTRSSKEASVINK